MTTTRFADEVCGIGTSAPRSGRQVVSGRFRSRAPCPMWRWRPPEQRGSAASAVESRCAAYVPASKVSPGRLSVTVHIEEGGDRERYGKPQGGNAMASLILPPPRSSTSRPLRCGRRDRMKRVQRKRNVVVGHDPVEVSRETGRGVSGPDYGGRFQRNRPMVSLGRHTVEGAGNRPRCPARAKRAPGRRSQRRPSVAAERR